MTVCLPFSFDGQDKSRPSADNEPLALSQSLQSFCSTESLTATEELLQKDKMKVIEQFLCRNFCIQEFARQMRVVREELVLREVEETAAGPRTISQVRKDRSKETTEGAAEAVACTKASSIVSLNTVLEADRSQGNMSIVVEWRCCYKGRIRTGICFLPALHLVQYSNSASTSPATSLALDPAARTSEFLQVSVLHDGVARIASGRQSCLVPVMVVFRSLTAEPLALSIESVDRRSSHLSTNQAAPVGAAAAVAEAASSSNLKKLSVKGLRWDRKTKHCGIELTAYGTTSVTFYANISKCGVFDLKRYIILF